MVRNVGSDPFQQLFERQRPITGMTALSLEILRLQRPQNPGHLLADHFDQRQFLLHVSLVVSQAFSKKPRIAFEQPGSLRAMTRFIRSA